MIPVGVKKGVTQWRGTRRRGANEAKPVLNEEGEVPVFAGTRDVFLFPHTLEQI